MQSTPSSSFLACTTNSAFRNSQQTTSRAVGLVLSHAASARWGFTIADDRQQLEAVIRRDIHSGFCSANQSPL